MDFDMRLELEIQKKDVAITDLRKYLDSAYEEIATAENGNKVDVRNRFEKIQELESQVLKLDCENKKQEKLVEELEAENDGLKEGMEVVTAEMEKLSEDKIALEEEVRSMKEQAVTENNSESLVKLKNYEAEFDIMKDNIKAKTDQISNLKLSNASLLETVDQLSMKVDEISQKNSEVLVSSAEVQRFNVELNEELSQLKV